MNVPAGWLYFLHRLSEAEQRYLRALCEVSPEHKPSDWLEWRYRDLLLGFVSRERAARILDSMPCCTQQDRALVWNPHVEDLAQRSDVLQQMLVEHKERGWVSGWRDERFSFWSSECVDPDPQRNALLSVERAGFRYLGMMSHAVHINGFTADGRIWCGRRAASKATDPGLLDNIAAGGLPSGETVLTCALRELQEEAGLSGIDGNHLMDKGFIRTSRLTTAGWHDETLRVYNLQLADDFHPHNQDGEVDGFICLHACELVERIRAHQFTLDAIAALLRGLDLKPPPTAPND